MTSEASSEKSDLTPSLLTMAADIVSAYVTKNAVPANELPTMILEIHASLEKLATCVVDAPGEAPKEPAVPIKKSGDERVHHLSRRWEEVQVAEASICRRPTG